MDFSKSALLLLIALLACAAPLISGSEEDEAEAPQPDTFFGKWVPIKDVTDPSIVAIGKFAVDEYNKKINEKLTFEKVARGAEKIVSGTYYGLQLSASSDSGSPKQYDALVYENLKQEKTLVGFKSV
uniref:Cystatin domain-containing protein n=1 Tax=Kalanchoe fedtschenkoi TaxID=63787 RepID=A0A7N0UHD2_KALFE